MSVIIFCYLGTIIILFSSYEFVSVKSIFNK